MAGGGQAASRPNSLVVSADDWGSNHAGAYGCTWINTPNFDRVAREGVLFNNLFTSNPKCSPCRATILTGRNTWQLKEAVNHMSIMPRDFAVYPDILEKNGYFSGCTGKGWGPGDYRSTGWPHNPAGKEWNAVKQAVPTPACWSSRPGVEPGIVPSVPSIWAPVATISDWLSVTRIWLLVFVGQFA